MPSGQLIIKQMPQSYWQHCEILPRLVVGLEHAQICVHIDRASQESHPRSSSRQEAAGAAQAIIGRIPTATSPPYIADNAWLLVQGRGLPDVEGVQVQGQACGKGTHTHTQTQTAACERLTVSSSVCQCDQILSSCRCQPCGCAGVPHPSKETCLQKGLGEGPAQPIIPATAPLWCCSPFR